ncbi:DUF1109 domain-containing protein [Parerythrobacter aestuarii]|uniref:DUF1109 domain-containing protein n=1 Tax=Parerythrobacter aestuarii TaxID=3020909 RepID=UPI0024DEFB68|nr:DUF1109 domain-containing protein [Parerythrobacter aestuarii]
MNKANQALIADLVDDLQPVRVIKARHGLWLAAVAGAITVLSVWLLAGLWSGMITGEASAFYLVTNGLLLLLGLAGVSAAVALASPSVGNRQDGPKWALAMVTILPLAAFATTFAAGRGPGALMDPYSLHCLLSGTAASALTFLVLAYWLRRGAPVSTETAGLFAGIAAGAIGAFAYGLSCPIDGVSHLGLWHVLPVAICGVLGRVILPPIIRW